MTTRSLYKADLNVIPSGAGSPYDVEVMIVADSFKGALAAAKPTTGYYSFDIRGLKRIREKAIIA